jgi:hypothetical protein
MVVGVAVDGTLLSGVVAAGTLLSGVVDTGTLLSGTLLAGTVDTDGVVGDDVSSSPNAAAVPAVNTVTIAAPSAIRRFI